MFAKLHDISVNFGEVRALNNVSLDISPNQIHAIVGENGAGKSTLMSVLFGLNVNYSGQIFIDEVDKNWVTPSDAIKAGIGNHVEGIVGAEVDSRYSPPIRIKGVVHSLKKGDRNAEYEAVIKVNNVFVIVTKKRKPYHYISDFTDINLDPKNSDLLVVKIGYLVPELYDIRGDWVMALTPGGVDQDLERLGYKNIIRPMYPLDKEMEDPDLSARLIN